MQSEKKEDNAEENSVKRCIKERFVLFCKMNKITQSDVARQIGTVRQSISTWFDLDATTMPSIIVLHWLVSKYALNPFWLFTGSGELLENSDVSRTQDGNGALVGAINSLTSQITALSKINERIADGLSVRV